MNVVLDILVEVLLCINSMRLSLECLQISMVDQCVITIKGRENITYTNGLHLGTRSADQNKQTTLIHLCIFIRDFTSTMVYLVEVKNGNETQYLRSFVPY